MLNIPQHLFVGIDGNLYDTRKENWHNEKPLRPVYNKVHCHINTVAELKATLRHGMYAWTGGYPLHFITSDGASLSFKTVRDNLRDVIDAIKSGLNTGWKVVALDINYEDGLIDDHTGEPLESAFGDTND